MSEGLTEETTDSDYLNLNTYGWAEWTIFIILLLFFGCCCCGIGVCYNRWSMRHLILHDEDIQDIEKKTTVLRFRQTMSAMFSPRTPAKPMSFNETEISRNIGKSIVAKRSQSNISNTNGIATYDTIESSETLPANRPDRTNLFSFNSSQMNDMVGKSILRNNYTSVEDETSGQRRGDSVVALKLSGMSPPPREVKTILEDNEDLVSNMDDEDRL